MCGIKSKAFCFLFLLCFSLSSISSEEKRIYLTQSEMDELQTLIQESQQDILQYKKELETVSLQLTTSLNAQIQLQTDYQERKNYWTEQTQELKNEITKLEKTTKLQDLIIKFGALGTIVALTVLGVN